MQNISASQSSAEVPINENFQAVLGFGMYARKPSTTTGLTYGYYGNNATSPLTARWGGFSITDGTVSLTASSTNYLVVNRSTGALTASTATTNWNNVLAYARVAIVTTTTVITGEENHRTGPFGVHGGVAFPEHLTTGGTSTAYTLTPAPAIAGAYTEGYQWNVRFHAACGAAPTIQVNGIATPPNLVYQKADGTYANLAAGMIQTDHRSVVKLISSTQALVVNVPPGLGMFAPTALTSGTTVNTDAALGTHFTLVLAHNATLANPTNLVHGTYYRWRIKQDGTGSRTLAYGTKFKWAGGTAPTLSTAAGKVDTIQGMYDATDDTLAMTASLNYA